MQGPLNVPRSPQGQPLLVQAGSSADGKAFAARYAEAVFTAQQTLADGQALLRRPQGRPPRYGRDPRPGQDPARHRADHRWHRGRGRRALRAELDDLIVPDYALAQLSHMLGIDLHRPTRWTARCRRCPASDSIDGHQSRYTLIVELARRENLTIRQLLVRLGGGRGHRVVAGTPEQIADELELWFAQGAADGFNIMPPYLPGGLDDFVDHVVPILQRRGLFRHEYTGTRCASTTACPNPPTGTPACRPAPDLMGTR